ncbi:MAG: FIST C-terminal domain-containing protein [Cyclobacteriaceae bacterium]|nr:FIST C-terminal domain-containing protein [Cyclobacteriaceae bacterium]
MNAKSIKGKSIEEIRVAISESMNDGFLPTLAVVFLSVKQDIHAICELLDKRNIAVFGATTHGEFIDAQLGKESVAILLLDLNPEYFSVLFSEYPDKNYREVASTVAKKAQQLFPNPTFLMSFSNLETDAEQLLFGFEDVIGKDVNVFGGGAGDDYNFQEPFVFTNGQSSNAGMVVLVFDQNTIEINGRAVCGWKAMGTEKTVTKSEGNHVYTVDDIPVLDLTAKYSGIDDISPENKDMMMEIATNFPLQLQRGSGAPVMRPGLLVDWKDHSFYCSGTVPQGSKVRFSLPPDFDVIDEVIQSAQKMKSDETPEADALILFSCGGRILALGPLMNKEIEGVKKVWEVPMVGMFSNAELGRSTGGDLEMHNLTTCCVALKEK